MTTDFKPKDYSSVSPYFIVNGAQRFIDLMKALFDAQELRRYEGPEGRIMHAELRVYDSVIMLSDATEKYPPVPSVMHVYVPDADATYRKAMAAGCTSIEPPKQQDGDPDRRATFTDFAGNMWSVGTQMPTE